MATSGALPPLMAAIRLGSNVSVSGFGWSSSFTWIQGYRFSNRAMPFWNGFASSWAYWCQTVSVARDPAAEDDELRVEHGDDGGDRERDPAGDPLDDGERCGLAAAGGREDALRRRRAQAVVAGELAGRGGRGRLLELAAAAVGRV